MRASRYIEYDCYGHLRCTSIMFEVSLTPISLATLKIYVVLFFLQNDEILYNCTYVRMKEKTEKKKIAVGFPHWIFPASYQHHTRHGFVSLALSPTLSIAKSASVDVAIIWWVESEELASN